MEAVEEANSVEAVEEDMNKLVSGLPQNGMAQKNAEQEVGPKVTTYY